MFLDQQVLDAQTLSLLGTETLSINNRVYEARYPSWDFSRLVSVNTSGGEWSGGTLTFTSDMSGKMDWQSTGAKDVPLAHVSQDYQTMYHRDAALGYEWHVGEVQRLAQTPAEISNLVERRARAARRLADKFLYDLTLVGDARKGMSGLVNNPDVPVVTLPADGDGGVTYWVNSSGVGTKTPAQIVRDINLVISGVYGTTFGTILADTLMLPKSALTYIASTPFSAVTMETILSFVAKNNRYTLETGRELRIIGIDELEVAGTAGEGRIFAYYNAEDFVQLHLPMPFRFFPIYQDGPFSFAVPGLLRTGGVEFLAPDAAAYADGVTEGA